MREVMQEIGFSSIFDKADLEKKLHDIIWSKYEQLRKTDFFKIKVLKFITIDISGKVAELLTKWFGENPYGQAK